MATLADYGLLLPFRLVQSFGLLIHSTRYWSLGCFLFRHARHQWVATHFGTLRDMILFGASGSLTYYGLLTVVGSLIRIGLLRQFSALSVRGLLR